MRFITSLVVGLVCTTTTLADESDDTLRYYLSKTDLAIVAQVVGDPHGIVDEDGVTNYICEIRVSSVLTGDASIQKTLSVNIERFDETGGVPAKGGNYILFLKNHRPNTPAWATADFWFGILPYHKGTSSAVKRVADMMADEARWARVRGLGDREKPEQIPELIEIADGTDQAVALEALSQLGNYKPMPEIIAFLNRKMKDKDPQIALKAAIISCYSGDWSGFDMLLDHVAHCDATLRCAAVAQLVDIRFRVHAKRASPLLLERLHVEKDSAVLERAIESLGNFPSPQVLEAIRPFLQHEDERVRSRAKLVDGWTTRDLEKARP